MAVTNDLVTDQRADRSCKALVEAGYAVTLVGRRLPQSAELKGRPYHCVRMRLLFRRSVWFYAEYNIRLFLKLLVTPTDAFYANDSDTLLACRWAAGIRHKPLLFDAHELFPDVPELVDKPRVRQVWRWVERKCLPKVDAAFTVSQCVAEEYRRRYGVKMTVVRNLPETNRGGEATVEKKEKSDGEPFVLLYQGAVNVGRGVREMVDVMQLLPQCRLVVAGNGDLLEELRAYTATLPWKGQIEFLGRVEPERLHRLTREADLGVCLLEELGLSYRCALPNRIGDFVQAGVPMVATGFCEIRRVIEEYGIGTTTEACPKAKAGENYSKYLCRLADTIMETLHLWQAMPKEKRDDIFAKARHELCWEQERHLLTDAVAAVLPMD